jgi:hypothetical protein
VSGDLRELLVRADSYLSLLWHRHVPADRKDTDLRFNVERTIGDLRMAADAVDPQVTDSGKPSTRV